MPMIRPENLRSGYIQDDVEEYLYSLLPKRDAVIEGMEEFAGTVDGFVGLFLVQGGTVAGQLADVGERVEQVEFGVDHLGVVAGQHAPQRVVLGQQDAHPLRADVVARDQATQLVEPGEGLATRGDVVVLRLGAELDPRCGVGGGGFADLVET